MTEAIPAEFGRLQNLTQLLLSNNNFSGNIPTTFGDLASLKELSLTNNTYMSGVLPSSLIGLNLESLLLGDTGPCAPSDPAFQNWLRAIPVSYVANCPSVAGRSTAYLTQAVQSLTRPVPLVAGEDALLRVFVTTQTDDEILLPPVRAAFYLDGTEVHLVDLPGGSTGIPRVIEEGDLSYSANSTVPGSIVTLGLEMVVEIDPDGELNPALGFGVRLPPTGRTPVDVRDVPPLHLTMVPFLWTENPDRSILTQVETLTADSDMFRLTRDLLPVGEFSLDIHEPVWISVDPGWDNLGEVIRITKMISNVEGTIGHHHMGVLRNGGGWGELGDLVSVAVLEDWIIAHELGHNMNLLHAPCQNTPGADPEYPHPDGSIGAWGYDLLNEELVSPDTPDLMGYCDPRWISDYSFSKAMGYRLFQSRETTMAASFAPSARSLLLWGGVKENGEIVLEPAFVVDAPPSLPQMDGAYRITGEGRDGSSLFSLSFGMAEIADSDGARSFAFIVPVRRDWRDRLTRITVSGPEGFATLGGEYESEPEDAPSAALLLDPATGKVRGVLRDWPAPGLSPAAARRTAPEPGLEVVISPGVPDQDSW